jgi:hypothetical protein
MASEQASGELQQYIKAISASASADRSRAERRLARGLEDVSHLFLSQAVEDAGAKPEAAVDPSEASQVRAAHPAFVAGSAAATAFGRDQLLSLLSENTAALEEGMRAIDANLPCDPYSPIDLLAVDVANRLAIIDLDTGANDGMLLRGMCHFDWLVRNMRFSRRMYHGHVIDGSSPPRIFLVAPQFSPMLSCAAHRMTGPQVTCVRYHALTVAGGTGILLERV